MATTDYQAAWAGFQESVVALYEQPSAAMVERGEGDIARTGDWEDRAQRVIDQSQTLGRAAAQERGSDDPGRRELAGLQLLAGAAYDLSIANDLVRLDEEQMPPGLRERSATLPASMSALQPILAAPPEAGMHGLLLQTRGPDRGAEGPNDPALARAALQQAVGDALADIRDDAADAGQSVFVGLLELPLPPIKNAATVAVHEILDRIGDSVSAVIRKAVHLIVNAIDKLLEALGKEAQDEARKKAAEWIEDLKSGTLFTTLVDRLYETERIQETITEQLEGGGDLEAAAFNQASQEVTELATKYRMQKDTLGWVLRGLAWARAWILALEPWGPLAITAAYVVALGYVVYTGGDYVDWFRTGETGRLDFVPGVRQIVDRTLSGA